MSQLLLLNSYLLHHFRVMRVMLIFVVIEYSTFRCLSAGTGSTVWSVRIMMNGCGRNREKVYLRTNVTACYRCLSQGHNDRHHLIKTTRINMNLEPMTDSQMLSYDS